MAVAAPYVACVFDNVKIKQSKIAKMTNVIEVTVRNRYKDLKEILQLILNSIDSTHAVSRKVIDR